ncbi:MAG TPA: hypothetical protein VKX49_15840 [Bryobacteraceae bacterium]|nr:hypothetical protein [Bryobacteraceae bacterium]
MSARLVYLTTVGCWVGLAAGWGQTAQNAVDPDRLVQHAVDGTLRATLDPTKRMPMFTERTGAHAPVPSPYCSVPLLEMKMPADVDFTLKKIPPPPEYRDRMPATKGFAPCPQPQTK